MKPNPLPPREELLHLFRYDPETGILYWRNPRSRCVKIGDRAGRIVKSGVQVSLLSKCYMAHRIIWKMLHNEEPPEIDHRDLDEFNNREINLRAATRSQNNQNRRVFSNSQTGIKGVTVRDGKFLAKIVHGEKRLRLGCFDTLEEAAKARADATILYHAEFGR